jgi:hypothetical protein
MMYQEETSIQLQVEAELSTLDPGVGSTTSSNSSSETESEREIIVKSTSTGSKGRTSRRTGSSRSRNAGKRYEDPFTFSEGDPIEGTKARKGKRSTPRSAASRARVEDDLNDLLGKRKLDASLATEEQLRQLREMLEELHDIKKEIAFLKSLDHVEPSSSYALPAPPPPIRVPVAPLAPPAKRPKRSHKKKMRDEEKQKLYADICALPADKLGEVLNFVKQICPDAIKYSAPDEAEIEILSIDNDNLWRLDRLCKRLSMRT